VAVVDFAVCSKQSQHLLEVGSDMGYGTGKRSTVMPIFMNVRPLFFVAVPRYRCFDNKILRLV
jgi:hypothetical protein